MLNTDPMPVIATLKQGCVCYHGSGRCLLISYLLLQYWAACITKAQEPNPWSSRDGRVLKPVPSAWRLPQAVLTSKVKAVMLRLHSVQAGLLCTAWGSSGWPDQASLALMRGLAYAQAGNSKQALRVSQMQPLLDNRTHLVIFVICWPPTVCSD